MEKVFKKDGFDSQEYNKLLSEFTDKANYVAYAIKAVEIEGITLTKDVLERVTATERSYGEYIQELSKKRIGTEKFLTVEVTNIIQIYQDVYNRTIKHVKTIREYKSDIPLKYEKGSAKVDFMAVEKTAKQRASYEIDAEAMQAYYNEVIKLKTAIEAFQAYEKANNLPDFLNKGFSFKDGVFYHTTKFADFTKKGASPEEFEKITRSQFLSK